MNPPALTYDLSLLERSHERWMSSAALRAYYGHLYADMRREIEAGPVLEIGSGIGSARGQFPGLETSDVIATKYVQRVVSAYAIPREGWAAVIAVDVLHHLTTPLQFLASAAEALPPGGRIVLAEPAETYWGRLFYGQFHHEPCRAEELEHPYRFPVAHDGSFANMGMARALFFRDRARIERELAGMGLRLAKIRYRDLLAYPATGGFSHRAFLPAGLVRGLLAAEALLPQALLRGLGLRMIIVLERIR